MERHALRPDGPAARLDRWLADVLPLSRSRIQALVGEGRVTVDGRPARASQSLSGGEEILVEVPPPPPSELVRDDIDVPVLYEDAHLMVVDKPAGLVVHPAKGHPRGTLVNALLHRLDQAGGDPARPGIVHRIDKGTSGVMVVTRTHQAHEALGADFAAHDLDRRYLALVWGALPALHGTVDAPLARHPGDRKRFAVIEGGRRAVTHWAVRGEARLPVPGDQQGGVVSLVECRLETGRTHQVRVHLTHLGHPLLGDPVYRGRGRPPEALRAALLALDHQLLHAWSLSFRHPADGGIRSFRAPPPPDFLEILAILRLSLPAAPGQDLLRRDMVASLRLSRSEDP